jgi:hypothetical protein
MMESTYLSDGHDPASLRWLDGARMVDAQYLGMHVGPYAVSAVKSAGK